MSSDKTNEQLDSLIAPRYVNLMLITEPCIIFSKIHSQRWLPVNTLVSSCIELRYYN